MSTFFGLELGRRALAAFRRAIDISGHNVANVNTPGYHRQRPVFSATDPYPSLDQSRGAYQVGTGVQITQIQRFFDRTIEQRLTDLLSTQQYNQVYFHYLRQIENMPALKTGVANQINDFFNAFQKMANSPESLSFRTIAIQKGISLSQGINSLARAIQDTRIFIDKAIQQDITQVNSYLEQLRNLNVLIQQVSAVGNQPNDLLDQRDKLLNELSKLLNIQTVEGPNNSIIIYIGGRVVMQNNWFLPLTGVPNPTNYNLVDIRFSDEPTGPNVNITNGKLKGLLDVRDSPTDGLLYYKQQLDFFATNFINAINAQHALGFDLAGNPPGTTNFFLPPHPVEPALNMQINPSLLDPAAGPALIAAASVSNSPGDGSNALAIARLANSAIIGIYTPADFFSRLVSKLGADVKAKKDNEQYMSGLLTQIKNLRDSISAVSLDEEATFLLEYQKSYSAAARLINIYNEIYDVILNLLE